MSKSNPKRIYLDYAAFTPISKTSLERYIGVSRLVLGNPNALHMEAIKAKKIIESSRAAMSGIFGIGQKEILFTSGATEANNLAIKGVIDCARKEKYFAKHKPHIITSKIEHSSILEVCRALEKDGKAIVTYIGVDIHGRVDLKQLKKELSPETVLVTIQYANNEVGTIEPIMEIAKEIRHYKKFKNKKLNSSYPLFHTDAAQAMQYLPVNITKLGVDFLTIDGLKIYGPSGIGALFVKRGTQFSPQINGGDQEFGFRAGTENTSLIAAFSNSILETESLKQHEFKRLNLLRNKFISEINKSFGNVRINGSKEFCLPNIINVSFPNYDNDELVLRLDALGFAISAKSACKNNDDGASYVLNALYGEDEGNFATIRVSLGRQTVWHDLGKLIQALQKILS